MVLRKYLQQPEYRDEGADVGDGPDDHPHHGLQLLRHERGGAAGAGLVVSNPGFRCLGAGGAGAADQV